jgi:hypothetical protein
MKDRDGKVRSGGKAFYEAPRLTVHGSFESLTQQDTDGRRFDQSFNAGDPIPPAFSS